jgi:hypothetical protein
MLYVCIFFTKSTRTNMPSDDTLAALFTNKVVLEIPLKYDEIYRFTYSPEFPGPLVHILFTAN